MVELKYEVYPEGEKTLFFVEFSKWSSEQDTYWKLCKRNVFNEIEGHPWALAEGKLSPNEGAEDLNTKKYLRFIVDSMNKNV
jgi:hypothetical protein